MNTTELTSDSKAILLLCGVFGGKKQNGEVKPLTITEYNKVVSQLVAKKLRPQDMLDPEILSDLRNDMEVSVGYQRISSLLKRGAALAFAIENWMSKGIWIVTRNDQKYPQRLKKKFGNNSPPILFGSGDRSLFNTEGLAVVGSRNVDEEGQKFTQEIGRFCAVNGISIISGGARGVDQVSMLAALDAYGTAIGVFADSLMKSSVSGKYRDAIMDQRMLLISPYNPDARFNVGNAMGRNKYIYALSTFALVISAEKDKGGTWAGASEELKRDKRVSIFVRSDGKIPQGNRELLKIGALPFPERPWDKSLFETLKNTKITKANKLEQISIFDDVETESAEAKETGSQASESKNEECVKKENEINTSNKVFEVVLPIMLAHMENWITLDELVELLDVRKAQLQDWIKNGVDSCKIEKKNRPVKYRRKKQ